MKKILILHTGGTFGMLPMLPRQTLAPGKIAEHITAFVPELTKIADIDFEAVFNLDSADMQPHHWQTIAEYIHRRVHDYDGFVIIHGTDSMVYTAAALSFMLPNPPCPVILTGSQRPLAEIRTDARGNLVNSVELALHPIREVCIFFGTRLFRGNRAVKISSTDFTAFESPNYPHIAEVGLDIRVFGNHREPRGKFELVPGLSGEVLAFSFFPGLKPEYLDFLTKSSVKAVVIEALGMGNVSIKENSLLPFVTALTQAGKLAVITSQSRHGRVDLSCYENGLLIQNAGGVGAGDMTTETTLVKLMHLLGQYPDDLETVRERLKVPLSGEISS
jgi:L-asparaginase